MNPHTLDFKSPLSSPVATPNKRRILGEIQNSPLFRKSPVERLKTPTEPKRSPLTDRNTFSPLTSRFTKRTTTKITRIFEERTRFKMTNKENNDPGYISETFVKLDVEEETRDFRFGGFSSQKENWSTTKLDFTELTKTFSKSDRKDMCVPEKDLEADMDPDCETLHDLEEEFDNDNFDQCTKYEIISTDSPNIISRGRTSSSRKINARNFVFGAPLANNEASTSFNKQTVNATRMLTFEDESFEFTSPATRKTFSVKKSLKFTETPTKEEPPKNPEPPRTLKFDCPLFSETPTKNPLRHEKSDSSIGSMLSSPSCSQVRLFTSESTTSMESGFISELEEPFLDLDEASNSPKMANFNDLLSGTIKQDVLTEKTFLNRPILNRSLSLNPEPRAKMSLFSIKEADDKRKRCEGDVENVVNKRRKSNNGSPKLESVKRPVLQRAFSENHASIMSALARSAVDPDLIGDFSLPYALPLVGGDHQDLKCISVDTLADLLRGKFEDSINDYQIIDCRYPYEYEGGHIPGAVNLYTTAQVQTLLKKPKEVNDVTKRSILVFHCEFSLERGPKLYRFLRSSDRSKNAENYPNLNYPEIYLLHKGYRTFYQNYPELCTPAGYTAMLDPQHTHLLRKHRSGEPTSLFTHHRSKPGHRLLY